MELLTLQYGILGHLLVYPEHTGEIMAQVSAEDFDSLPTRGLFEAVSRLYLSGAPIDPVTASREAGEGYDAAVEEALNHTASDGLYYCQLLREGNQLKKIQGCAYDLAGVSTMAQAEKTVELLNSLITLRQKAEVVTAHEAASDFIRRMGAKQKPEYLSLGIRELDEKLFIEPGDLILVGGYSSAGKTMLSLQFALALTEKYQVGYFTLETSPRKLTDRLVSHIAQVPLATIKACDLDEDAAQRAAQAARRLSRLGLDFIPASGMTVRDIQAVALNKRYQVIFVDYLQIISSPGKSRYEQVTNVSMALHTLAQSHGMTVFALAQLSRPEKTNGQPLPPNMASFRESGQLEQDADVAMLLWPEDPNDNRSNRILKIAKNKDGERGQLKLDFNGALQTLSPARKGGVSVAAQYAAAGRRAKQASRAGAAGQLGFQDIPDDTSPLPF